MPAEPARWCAHSRTAAGRADVGVRQRGLRGGALAHDRRRSSASRRVEPRRRSRDRRLARAERLGRGFDVEAHGVRRAQRRIRRRRRGDPHQRGTTIENALHLVFVGLPAGAASRPSRHVRNLIVGEARTATPPWSSTASANAACISPTPRTEISLARGAALSHVKVQDEADTTLSTSAVSRSRSREQAALASHVVTVGGALSRSEIDRALGGTHAPSAG